MVGGLDSNTGPVITYTSPLARSTYLRVSCSILAHEPPFRCAFWGTMFAKELVCTTLICIFNTLAVEPLRHIHRRLGLPTVQHCKRLIAKLTQGRALGHYWRTTLWKELATLRKASRVWNREWSLAIEITTGQRWERNKQCQRQDKR